MRDQDFLETLLSKEHREQLPDLETLAIALKCHRGRANGRSVADVADELGLGKDAVYRRLAKLERAFPPDGGDQEALYGALELLLDRFHSLMIGDQLRIRVGMSSTLAKVIAPRVLHAFKTKYRRPGGGTVDVELISGMPEALRRQGRAGDLDLVMCSCEPDDPPASPRVPVDVKLAMQLIVPRGHRLAAKLINHRDQIREDVLAGMTVVKLESHPDRRPLPLYPETLIEGARDVRTVETYEDMHRTVMSGGDVAGFSYGELLDEDERRAIDAIALPSCYASKLRICLIRPERARVWRSEAQREVIDDLSTELGDALRKVAKGVFAEGFVERVPKEWRLYHVSLLEAGGFGWSRRGELSLQITRDGVVKGMHTVPVAGQDGGDQMFDIFGQAIVNPSDEREVQIVWHAHSAAEAYVAGFTGSKDQLEEGALVGAWIGRSTIDKDRPEEGTPNGRSTSRRKPFRGAAGYMVAISRDRPELPTDGRKLAAALRTKIESHARQFGPLALLLPEESR